MGRWEQRRDPQERQSQEQQGPTLGTTLAWITVDAQAFPTDLGTRKGSGGAPWNIFPEHWMRGMQVGGLCPLGLAHAEAPFK